MHAHKTGFSVSCKHVRMFMHVWLFLDSSGCRCCEPLSWPCHTTCHTWSLINETQRSLLLAMEAERNNWQWKLLVVEGGLMLLLLLFLSVSSLRNVKWERTCLCFCLIMLKLFFKKLVVRESSSFSSAIMSLLGVRVGYTRYRISHLRPEDWMEHIIWLHVFVHVTRVFCAPTSDCLSLTLWLVVCWTFSAFLFRTNCLFLIWNHEYLIIHNV